MADSAARISGAGKAGPNWGVAESGAAGVEDSGAEDCGAEDCGAEDCGAEDCVLGGRAGCWAEAASESESRTKRVKRSTKYLCLQFNAGDWTVEGGFRLDGSPG